MDIVPRNFFVYILINSLTDTVFYVGKGRHSTRMSSHEWQARKGVQSYKCRIIREIWQQGGQVIKQKVAEFADEQDAFIYEWCLITLIYGRENLTNATNGGGGSSDWVLTEDGREHFRRHALRMWSDPEFRERRSRESLEYYANPEAVERNRQLTKGLWETSTYREKLMQKHKDPTVKEKKSKAASKREPNRIGTIEGFVSPQGQIFSPVINLAAFCKEHNLSYCGMWLVNKGTQPSHQGWTRYNPPGRDVPTFPTKVRGTVIIGNTFHAKSYQGFVAPDGTVYRDIYNLKAFCLEHDLSLSKMSLVNSGQRPSHKGWTRYDPDLDQPMLF